MNINIEPIESYQAKQPYGFFAPVCPTKKVRKLEANYQEAINALKNYYNIITVCSALDNYVVRIIEKATGKSWEELKE